LWSIPFQKQISLQLPELTGILNGIDPNHGFLHSVQAFNGMSFLKILKTGTNSQGKRKRTLQLGISPEY
jgi:hypothetical protein